MGTGNLTGDDDRLAALSGCRVIVAGGSGFIGSHLVRLLDECGAEVAVIGRTGTRHRTDSVGVVDANILDPDRLRDVVNQIQPEIVFHLAGFSHDRRSWDSPADCLRTNVEGTSNLLEALAGGPMRSLVNLSSAAVYGAAPSPISETSPLRPESPYGVSKVAAEQLCQIHGARHGWSVAQARLFNTYGPGQTTDRIIPEIIANVIADRPVRILRGGSIREFTFVTDVVRAIALCGSLADGSRHAINIGGGEAYAMGDLARRVIEMLESTVALDVGAAADHVDEVRATTDRAATLLGWRASTTLDDGLRATIEWMKAERSPG